VSCPLADRLMVARADLAACARCLRNYRYELAWPHAVHRRDPARVWLEARDIAQLYAALGFAHALRARRPDMSFVVAVPGPLHQAMAVTATEPRDLVLPAPCDCVVASRRALRATGTSRLAVFGNSLPLSLVRAAPALGVRVAWIGAEVSASTTARWVGPVMRAALRRIELVMAAESSDAERLRTIVAGGSRLTTVGSLKYDLAVDAAAHNSAVVARAPLRDAGIPDEAPVVLGGSLHAGELEVLLDAFVALRAHHAGLRLVLATRTVADSEPAPDLAGRRGLTVACRTAAAEQAVTAHAPDPDVLVLDTTGELRALYAAATVVFIGRTLTQHTGSSVLEAAAEGRAIVVGPRADHFAEDFTRFRQASAFVQVDDAAALTTAIDRLLADPAERAELGARARAVVSAHTGALLRAVELFEHGVSPRGPQAAVPTRRRWPDP
jgi:3-deoxy-D-manno-octulosonic-acid transferase